MSSLTQKIAEVRKAVVAVTGLAASLLADGLIPAPENHWIAAGLALLASIGVHQVPNATPFDDDPNATAPITVPPVGAPTSEPSPASPVVNPTPPPAVA